MQITVKYMLAVGPDKLLVSESRSRLLVSTPSVM